MGGCSGRGPLASAVTPGQKGGLVAFHLLPREDADFKARPRKQHLGPGVPSLQPPEP